jgi:hypothetical protein
MVKPPHDHQSLQDNDPGASREMIRKLRSEVAAALEQYGIEVEAFRRYALDCWREETWGRSPEMLTRALALLRLVGPKLVRLRLLLQGMDVPAERFWLYANRRFRHEHWQLQAETVARAIREVERYGQAPEALAALVEASLDAD